MWASCQPVVTSRYPTEPPFPQLWFYVKLNVDCAKKPHENWWAGSCLEGSPSPCSSLYSALGLTVLSSRLIFPCSSFPFAFIELNSIWKKQQYPSPSPEPCHGWDEREQGRKIDWFQWVHPVDIELQDHLCQKNHTAWWHRDFIVPKSSQIW